MTIGDRPMVIDLSYRPWEVSAAGIAALRKELSSNPEQIARVQIVGKIRTQLVEKPTPRAKTQSPSQLTEEASARAEADKARAEAQAAREQAEAATPGSSPPPTEYKSKRRGSRGQDAIREWADGKWPGGHRHLELRDIIKVADKDKEFRKKFPGDKFPERTKFARALKRRND